MYGYGKTRKIEMDHHQNQNQFNQEKDMETVKMSRPPNEQQRSHEYKSATSGLNDKDIQEIERMKQKQVKKEF